MQPSPDAVAGSPSPIWWITHEYAPFRGGAAVYVQEIARATAGLSIRSQVVTVDYFQRLNTAEWAQMHRSDSAEPYPVVRLKCSGRLTPGGILRLAAGLAAMRGALREASPVLMSAGAYMAAFLLYAAGRWPARRTVCLFYGSELLRFARHPLWRPLARRFFSRTAGFAAASRHAQSLALNSGLLPRDAIVCVAPCAVPSAYADLGEAAGDEGSPAPLNNTGAIRILTVGRLHPRKGQLEVAQALALLPAELRRRLIYRLVGVGAPSYRRQIEVVCDVAQMRSEFLGDVDERALSTLYARCAVYAQASRTMERSVEGFGISLLEAGFFGCPIAAFRSGGVTEAVSEGSNAILVDEGDIAGLSAAIATLINDPALRHRFGTAGRQFARGFSWENSARILAAHIRLAN